MENQSHVAVIPFPFASHPAATFDFTCKLAAAAPDATFSFFGTARSNKSLFSSQTSAGFANIKVYDVEDGVPEDYVVAGGMPLDLIGMLEKVTPENYKKGIEKAVLDSGKNITCMLAGPYMWQTADLAAEMNVPWVLFWTAGAAYLSFLSYIDLICNTLAALDHSGRESLNLSFIPGMSSTLCMKDVAKEVVSENMDFIITRMYRRTGQSISRATAVAFNGFEELDPSILDDFRSRPNKWLAVGPLNLVTSPSPSIVLDQNDCISWLGNKKPSSVAYISFGTLSPLPPDELIAVAEALDKTAIPFIWSLKDNMKKLLPQGFLDRTNERGIVIPWAPQSQILEHESVGVFVTHCGWKSVLESITGGVPLISRPFFGDQVLNAGFVSKVWKTGVIAKGGVLVKDGLIDAFNLVMFQEEGKKMRNNVGILKELAMQAVAPEGSSTTNFKMFLEIITTTK